jgi:isopentenyldiphosphate isomerase
MIKGYPKPFGYVNRSIISGLNLSPVWSVDHSQRLLTMTSSDSFNERTEVMRSTLSQAGKEGAPTSPQKFYDESLRVVSATGEHVLDMDRSGLDPFGVVSFSAHILEYVKSGDEKRYWVPKRSASKETVPNMLDSTVAGVIRSGESPLDCMFRKIALETSIPKEHIKDHFLSCGTISYQVAITSKGLPDCQHIISHLYEMEFSPDLVLVPDDEVEKSTLMTLDEVKVALMEGEFVANRALVWLAYLIRHGIMNPEK